MLIVDSQVHIWAADTPGRPWPPPLHGLKPAPHREEPITAGELLGRMEDAGVHRAILVPPSWEGDRNDVVSEAVKASPEAFRYVARYGVLSQNARSWVESWKSNPGMLGLQLTFQTPLFQEPLLEGKLDWLWGVAEGAKLPLTIYLPNVLAPVIDKVAEKHPALSIVINHFGLAGPRRDDDAFSDFENLLALAKRRNVAIKASCLPFYTNQKYPFPALHIYIRRAYDAFGPERLFWGTDLSRLPCSYREGVTLFTDELSWLSTGDLEWIMGRGICEWLGWDYPA